MSSTRRAPHTAPETAARIRDAAVGEFAAHGFAKTTVRGIAAAAGVSPGLVIHHFGSKDALRAVCDDHVFAVLTARKRENAHRSPFVVAELFGDPEMRTHAEYLLKSILDPSEHGQRFFDHYVDMVERFIEDGFAGYTMRQGEDRRAQSATIAALALAPLMLEPKLRRALGTADLQDSMGRIAPSLYDLYLHGFIESVPESHATPGPRATPGSQHDPPAEPVP
ncbi:TetR/AcrR family transcriptional regulator [Microbacterium esteraromaticum]|uniref:TetR/AcrR family transcriptional regulator n=1 Tax=Microbacterium esteraromaticum TaxID=57043 RepID=A0A939DXL6_9MICO|nr:TetR/AcrR family transcriptional regulator [Microbacterium esteraromaticum]MBN8206117.1 TetR/AcrR family transcriptional regulator [Microbacterium esteraromaticum]MBN8416272.1 TetR/AcrR family transcriptional regulator [Microbacterium esteraromaticum]MBN8423372.1 TetR/AcrR family transcriptional regulator [Microbacterium esteraromaticum]